MPSHCARYAGRAIDGRDDRDVVTSSYSSRWALVALEGLPCNGLGGSWRFARETFVVEGMVALEIVVMDMFAGGYRCRCDTDGPAVFMDRLSDRNRTGCDFVPGRDISSKNDIRLVST